MTMSIIISDINLDGLATLPPWLVLALSTLWIVSKHFKLIIALLLAVTSPRYRQQFLNVFEQLERPSSALQEGDPSGTPRRKKSRKRT